ncbi:hypothetical protein DXD55_10290 [Bacteroides stercoris]|nr:hypothetical protein DXD55_10290 [Bacteroides stercoris]
MQTTAIGTVANSLPKNKVILLTLLSSKRYILIAELCNIFVIRRWQNKVFFKKMKKKNADFYVIKHISHKHFVSLQR